VAEQVSALRQAGGGDLVAAFAHVPMHVMCALLGVPAAAVCTDFIAWVDALSPVFLFMEPDQITRAETAITDLLAYVEN
jgi:cytochrome P450